MPLKMWHTYFYFKVTFDAVWPHYEFYNSMKNYGVNVENSYSFKVMFLVGYRKSCQYFL